MDHEDCPAFVYEEGVWNDYRNRNYEFDAAATLETYENAIIEPLRLIKGTRGRYGDGLFAGGVCTDSFEFIAGLRRSNDRNNYNKNCVESYPVPESDIERRNESVVFGGILTSHFGHMLCDGLTRLWYFPTHPEDMSKVVFVTMPGQEFKFWDFLEMAGIERSRIEIIERPTMFSQVTVPSETFFTLGNQGFKREFRATLQAMRESVEPGTCEKVYFSRTALARSGCIGEEYFESFFASQGFTVVHPELLSIREQVSLISGAREIATTAGTLSTQIIFARPGTHLIALNRSSRGSNAIFNTCQLSGAIPHVIDVHFNIFPEEQAGNCVWLLGPTSHWKRYVESRSWDNPADIDVPYSLADNLLDYVRLWGSQYANRANYRWIRNETVPDIIARINRYLLESNIDATSFPSSRDTEALARKVQKLETERNDLLARVAYAETNAHITAYAVIQQENEGQLVITGALPTSTKRSPDPDSRMPHIRVAFRDENDGIIACAVCECSLTPAAEGERRWTAILDLEVSGKSQISEQVTLEAHLEIPADGAPEVIPVALDSTAQPLEILVVPFAPRGLYLKTITGKRGIVGTFTPNRATWEEDPRYRITDLYWDEDRVIVRFDVRHALASSNLLDISLALQRNHETSAEADDDDARDQAASIPLATVASQPGSRTLEAVIAPWSQNANKLLEEGCALSFTLAARFIRSDRTVSLPFGRKRPSGTFAVFSGRSAVSGDIVFAPVEDRNRTLGFEVMSLHGALDREAAPRITEIEWREGVLFMKGTMKHPLSHDAHFSCSWLLACGDASIMLPVEWSRDEKTGVISWSASLDCVELFAGAAPGAWEFMIEKCFDRMVAREPFGRKRPKGSMARFIQHIPRACSGYAIPFETQDHNLGFDLARPSEALSTTSQPSIEKLEWNVGALTVSVATQDPITFTPGYSISFALACEGEKPIPLPSSPVRAVGSPSDDWVVSITPESIANAPSGTWGITALETLEDAATATPFGKRRPKGSFAAFRSRAIISKEKIALPVELDDKLLGFHIVTLPELLALPISPKISALYWDSTTLNMKGTGRTALTLIEESSLEIGLSDGEKFRPVRSSIEAEDNKTHFTWNATIDLKEDFQLLKPATWHFALRKRIGDGEAIELFGKRRPAGTLDVFLSQSYKRFGMSVTPIDQGPSLAFSVKYFR